MPDCDKVRHFGCAALAFAATLVPRPRLHLIRFHGVLAPDARLRSLVVLGGAGQGGRCVGVRRHRARLCTHQPGQLRPAWWPQAMSALWFGQIFRFLRHKFPDSLRPKGAGFIRKWLCSAYPSTTRHAAPYPTRAGAGCSATYGRRGAPTKGFNGVLFSEPGLFPCTVVTLAAAIE